MENNEIINEGIDTVTEYVPIEIDSTPKKLIFGGLCFVGGIITTKVIVPGVKKLAENIKLKKRHKDLEDEILDESEVEFVD